MATAPWGTEGWGSGLWGAGLATSPVTTIARLKLIRTNVVRVWFAAAPKALDRSGFTDALNPRNWATSRTDGSGGYAPEVVRVLPVDGSPLAVDLWVVVPFLDAVAYTITANDNIVGA